MENKVRKNNLKNMKNINIKMGVDSDRITKLKEFYNTKIKKTHIICMTIMVVIFVLVFIVNIGMYKSGANIIPDGAVGESLSGAIQENFLMCAVVIFAGITPYCFLSVLGIAESAVIVGDMSLRYAWGSSFLPTMFLGGIIQMIGFSLCVAIGIYYCRLTTRKRKYYNYSSFSFNDVRQQIYEIRKDEKKVKELEKKKKEKYDVAKNSNVKIPYMNFLLLGILAFAITFVGLVITRI